MAIVVFALLLGAVLGDVSVQFPPDYSWDEHMPIDEYVHSDDGFWEYTEITSHYYPLWEVTVFVYNMTSQKWMDEEFVDRPIWWHWMSIAIPDAPTVKYPDKGILFIDGGSNNPDTSPPDHNSTENVAVAEGANLCKCYVGVISQVPNEPLYFHNDPEYKRRSEDAIIAWTWYTFANDPTYYKNPEVVLRMPMTKAAKRGLDTIAAVAAEKHPIIANVVHFGVSGASKRGWTTWSIAASDTRVTAAAPIVMSLLNMTTCLDYHNRAMNGGWSFALAPYFNEGLTRQFFDPNVVLPGGLWDHEDMFRYRSRLGMIPKLSIAGTGDEFFFPQDFQAWWDEMPGPASKHMMMVANAEHSLAPWYLSIFRTAMGWLTSLVEEKPLPEVTYYSYHTEEGVRLVMNAWPPPLNFTAWVGKTVRGSGLRDFRMVGGSPPAAQAVLFRRQDATELGPGEYTYFMENPDLGGPGPGRTADTITQQWGAVFLVAEYEPYPNYTMKLTTPVMFSPDTYPADKCLNPDQCEGWLC